MTSKNLLYMTGTVIIAMLVLMAGAFFSIFWNPDPPSYLNRDQVRGMAIQVQKKLYTLNFDQQNGTVDFLNRLVKEPDINKFREKVSGEHPFIPDFDKLIIYGFNELETEVIPIASSENNDYFFIPAWSDSHLFMDTSQGKFKKLISQTHKN